MKTYLFFYEGEENGWTFTIEANDHKEAFEKAYEEWGPQVEGMYCKEIQNNFPHISPIK